MIDALAADLQRQLSARKEGRLTELIGLEFRQDIRVRVRRPRWMPDHLYRWLMRTIVVEEGPLTVGDPGRRGTP